jgi:hypothetical protein
MFKVDYTYFIINDFEGALRKSSVFELIGTFMKKKKDLYYYKECYDFYGAKSKY